ncbi:MAG: hypothetical protein AABY00_00490 [Nanoarchaeota archaeon]
MNKRKLISGKEATYRVKISPQAEKMIRTLLHQGGYGRNMNATIEWIVGDWLIHQKRLFELFELSVDQAKKEGYLPFRVKDPQEDRRSGNKRRGGYDITLRGMAMYKVDKLAQTGLFGETNAQVVERVVYRALEYALAEEK